MNSTLDIRRERRNNYSYERAEPHNWNHYWRLTNRQAARTQAIIFGTEPLLKANGESRLMAEITLWNTATRRKELFRPIDPGNVRMYLCGPTVYERAHIGNARPSVVFDVLFSLLKFSYGADCVTFVRNFTDIDDKIIAKAEQRRSQGCKNSVAELTRSIADETIRWYHEDMDSLGVARPTHEPRATEFIPQMISMIEALCSKQHAYVAEGHVLFSVDSYRAYGSLARRDLADMRAGARVEVAPYKKNPLDFVLWKPSPPGWPSWPSPWGRGRPGWHIECSAMSKQLLGKDFDIHAGGIDLVFPHHENEAAQSLCAHPGSAFANFWMHNGMLQIEGGKMAKSLGNFRTVKDLREQGIQGEVARMVLLSAHYRQPLDWTGARVDESGAVLARWRRITRDAEMSDSPDQEFLEALCDDLNTPRAIARLHRLFAAKSGSELKSSACLLGLLGTNFPPGSSAEPEAADVSEAIESLLAVRSGARAARDYRRADAIRDALIDAGVEVNDSDGDSSWRLAPGFDSDGLERIVLMAKEY